MAPSSQDDEAEEFVVVHLPISDNYIVCGHAYVQGNLNKDGTMTVTYDEKLESGVIMGSFRNKEAAIQFANTVVDDKNKADCANAENADGEIVKNDYEIAEAPALTQLDPSSILIPISAADLKMMHDQIEKLEKLATRHEDLLLNVFAKLHSAHEIIERQNADIASILRAVTAVPQATVKVEPNGTTPKPAEPEHRGRGRPKLIRNVDPANTVSKNASSSIQGPVNGGASTSEPISHHATRSTTAAGAAQAPPSFKFIDKSIATSLFNTCVKPKTFLKRVSPLVFASEDLSKPMWERDAERVVELRRILAFMMKPATAAEELEKWNECVEAVNREVAGEPEPPAADEGELYARPKRGRPARSFNVVPDTIRAAKKRSVT